MRILAEPQVPAAIRLRDAARTPAVDSKEVVQLKEIHAILRSIADRLQTPPPSIDLSPVVDALARQTPPAPPSPAKGWTFTIERDADGLIAQVHAHRTA